ncbi:MAG: hypothetical protein A2X12_07610 [Bacteroidetes bacterium GWE2_29_8]|nr:MAG: hypothetical protein A2X12_07610 [Bacteroidetes bacterium GWE2_29_8]OFY22738.1 MAG: hypothetical protein A2X02_02175 [Bacteroidetes bacterium GWF2_29_10]
MPVMFLFVKGYIFNTEDHGEVLLPIYKLMSPELYSNDYFVAEYIKNSFTIRFYYDYLLYFSSFLVPLEIACFLFTIISIGISSFYIYSITELLKGKNISLFLSPILVLVIFYSFTIGGNFIQYNYFLPSSLSKAFLIAGIYYYLKQSLSKSAIITGIAALFHPLAALQVFIIICLMQIIKKFYTRTSFKPLLKFILFFTLISSFIYIPLYINSLSQTQYPFNLDNYYNILYNFRLPHHFNPLLFSLKSYFKFIILLTISIYALSTIKTKFLSEITLFIIIIALGMLFYTITFSTLSIKYIGITQWFKTSIWITMFCAIILAVKAELIYHKISQRIRLFRMNQNAVMLLIFIIPFILISFIFNIIGNENFNKRYYINNLYKKENIHLMHYWISKNTDVNDVFITFPSDFSFQPEAKRALISGYKAILIHNKTFIPKWYDSYKSVFNTPMSSINSTNVLIQSDLNYHKYLIINQYSQKYKINYILFDASKTDYKPKTKNIAFQAGQYILEKI